MTQRVIKFRAWHNEAKAMLQVGDNHGTTHPLDCALYARQGQDVVLMLWTGLTDKHGKEIYEGDILSFDFNPEMAIYGENHDRNPVESDYDRAVYIVQYEDGYRLCGKGIRRNLYLHAFRFQYTKRLGDIYTTPELVDPKMIENGNS